jgi:hypothetical protein
MKTGFDFLKENGIVCQRETGIEVINNPNYYGLLNAMNAYAVYYAKYIYREDKNDGLSASHREEDSPRNSGWSV